MGRTLPNALPASVYNCLVRRCGVLLCLRELALGIYTIHCYTGVYLPKVLSVIVT